MKDFRKLYDEAKDWLFEKFSKEEKELTASEPVPGIFFGSQLLQKGALGGGGALDQIARELGMPVYSTLVIELPRQTYEQISYSYVKKHLTLPFQEEKGSILCAVADPLKLEALEYLQVMLGKPIKAVYCPKEMIMTAINECYHREAGAAQEMLADLSEQTADLTVDADAEVYDLLDDSRDQAPIVKLLNLILVEAINQGASDIHFEPMEDTLRVRYRIDGVLHDRHAPGTEYQAQMLTRLKVMAKMDIAERRLPQDGRIKLKMGRREIDFRVSTIPIVNGERIVLRILDRGSVVLGLDQIGMSQKTLDRFKKLIQLPEGIVLVTGPTGSGKTTTLYSAISDLNSEEVNIMTIEDPVEYNLKGIAQMGVKPKIHLTFAAGLRTILRQDPDVILVGEIRDQETAEIAIQASLTGHLVLSTLHTNDAPSAITRLVDMGVEPYLLSSTIVGVLAQRLVRKICPDCKTQYTPKANELQSIRLDHKGRLWKGKGCDACYQSGYRGRHGVYELLPATTVVQQQIVKSADANKMRQVGLQEGMTTLREHGTELILNGITTIEEVLRVIRTPDEE